MFVELPQRHAELVREPFGVRGVGARVRAQAEDRQAQAPDPAGHAAAVGDELVELLVGGVLKGSVRDLELVRESCAILFSGRCGRSFDAATRDARSRTVFSASVRSAFTAAPV